MFKRYVLILIYSGLILNTMKYVSRRKNSNRRKAQQKVCNNKTDFHPIKIRLARVNGCAFSFS